MKASDIAVHVASRSNGPGIDGIDICCQTAADIIGTTPQFVSAAVKAGFIDGKVGLRNSALPLGRVLAVRKEFMLTDELRETFGRHQKAIGCELRKAGVKPATTINRTIVWLRTDIERYIANASPG